MKEMVNRENTSKSSSVVRVGVRCSIRDYVMCFWMCRMMYKRNGFNPIEGRKGNHPLNTRGERAFSPPSSTSSPEVLGFFDKWKE